MRYEINYLCIVVLLGILTPSCRSIPEQRRPNFIVIFADDLGYGDLGCYGSTKHRTPHIDQMADEGVKFTDFYVSSPYCSPSRAGLLTGCYPRRVNMDTDADGRCVIFPVAPKGLNPDELNIANHLKSKGYRTACIGKWHLGDQPEFLPTNQGFDLFFGLPYSNDTDPEWGEKRNFDREFPPIPLMRNETVIEAPVNQHTLTKRYTEEAIRFIEENRDAPFFLYLPHTMPHKPPHSSERFSGKSVNKGYGDAVEEIDWSTGEILKTLKALKLDKNTLVIFTSDNGASPWVKDGKGSNFPLRGMKGSTWEGGMREPFIAWWPGQIPEGQSISELATSMDILPTLANLAESPIPADHRIDGLDIWPLLCCQPEAKSPHEVFYYYLSDQLQAIRSGPWKLHLPLDEANKGCMANNAGEMRPLALYNLENDIGETQDVAGAHQDIVEKILLHAEKAIEDLGDKGRPGKNQRPAGYVNNPVPLTLKQ